MFGSKTFTILSLVFGAIGTVASVVQAVDSIKNGDKRAAIAGAAAGDQISKQRVRMFAGRRVDENGNFMDDPE